MMRKLFVLITLIIGTHASLFSQEYEYVPFPDSAAIWSEVFYWPHREWEEGEVTYERFALTGEDTVLNDKIYKKLYLFYDTVFKIDVTECIGGIREDSLKRIYYAGKRIHSLKPLIDFDEVILYDFSLKVGDTIMVDSMYNVDGYTVVESIDTVQIGNTLRKRFSFDYAIPQWIEGIGCRSGLLYAGRDYLSAGVSDDNRLMCFFQNDTLVFHAEQFEDCFTLETSINQVGVESDLNIYPNPVFGDVLIFNWNSSNAHTIEIYSNIGDRIEKLDVEGKTSITFSTIGLTAGCYYYKATTLNGEYITGKFVVR
jgi:hypothetical protein